MDATAFDEEVIVGQIAHIVGSSDVGPRSHPDYPTSQRDLPENLLLFCATHHVLVDGQDSSYTVEQLRRWKRDHEAWVDAQLEQAVTEVTFAELDVVCSAVVSSTLAFDADLTLLSVGEKKALNDLSDRVDADLQVGLLGAGVVQAYLEQISAIDPDFPERLKAGLVQHYEHGRDAGLHGDALFLELVRFAGGDQADFRRQAAGRAVVAYLFQVCDLFEH